MAEAAYPIELRYHKDHDWARMDGDIATFGVTWFAQHSMGDVVFFEPPEVGQAVAAGESYGELESVKAVSDLVAPLGGEVVEFNQQVVDAPESVNEDPYGAWLVRVRVPDPAAAEELMSADEYRNLVG